LTLGVVLEEDAAEAPVVDGVVEVVPVVVVVLVPPLDAAGALVTDVV
jgi:hypothetical protein